MQKEDTRKKIIKILQAARESGKGKLTYSELKKEVGVSDPVLAKHLKRLIEEGIVKEEIDRRDRRIKWYEINISGLNELKNDLLSVRLAIWIISELGKIYDDYRDKMLRCKNDYKCLNNITKEFINSVREIIANFVFLCHPDDISLFCTTMWFLSSMFNALFANIKEIVIHEDAIKFFEELKKKDVKTLFDEVKNDLYKLIVWWTCLAQTTPEEMRKVIEKYYDRDVVEIACRVWLGAREGAIKALDVICNTWIGKAIKVNSADVPSFEDIIKSKVEKR